MKKVFVTGATGFLGLELIEYLLQNNYELICLARNPNRIPKHLKSRIKIVNADMFSDLSQHLKGLDAIVHIAAITKQNLLSYKDYKKINLDATVLLLESAIKEGVKDFIYVSTANTIAYGLENCVDDDSEIKYPFTKSHYAVSKFVTEKYLKSKSKEINISILNPCFIIDDKLNPVSSNRLLDYLFKAKIILYPSGGKNFVYVQDVVKAIQLILEQYIGPKKILISGENLTYKNLVDVVLKSRADKAFAIPVPDFVLKLIGKLGDFFNSMGIKFFMNSTIAEILSIHNFYPEYSLKQLNIQQTNIQSILKKYTL